jgi:hypothetical protein
MKSSALLACACTLLVAGCGTMPAAERQYLDAEAQRIAQRPAGVLVAGCVLVPLDQGPAMLQDASQRLATGFAGALNQQLASAATVVANTDTPRLCPRIGPPVAADLAGAYERLLHALADVKKDHLYTSAADLMVASAARPQRVALPTARWPVALDEADARLLATEFGATDLWVLRASGTSVEQLSHFAGDMASIVISALAGASSAPVSNARNDVRYEISLVDLERREVVWMKLGRPTQINPETADIPADERFSTLLTPFLEASGTAP